MSEEVNLLSFAWENEHDVESKLFHIPKLDCLIFALKERNSTNGDGLNNNIMIFSQRIGKECQVNPALQIP